MKRDFASRLLFPLCGMLALTVTSCNKTAKDQPSRHRFIHNNDGSDALLNRWFGGHPAHKADIDRYVDMVAETSKGRTQVTTFMMCSGSDFIYYPSSKYGRYFGDDKNGTMPYADSATKKVWQLGGSERPQSRGRGNRRDQGFARARENARYGGVYHLPRQ